MNKYIVAHTYAGDSYLAQVLVEATSKRAAMLKYLEEYEDVTFNEEELLDMESADAVEYACLNMDALIAAYKL